ncbi:hypothetical protein [Tahibacter amnicola]|uniref:Uncharacterized protein n=1 Tax=Tahibacter amnicola TaxID=2976241 RepID=A0ABY6BMV3_9GAMM|nr:hypothetical protein [Tahibacter amnicola]UXI69147.1 hypothetical protein N4264_05710 [Tahibacter amnicola]
MRALTMAIAMAVVLTGCGGGREELAAKACESEVRNKLAGRTFELDLADLAAKAKPEQADVLYLSSQIVFDKGLTSEYRQTVECKVRLDPGKEPSVIFLQFNWSMDEIKKN